MRTALLEPLCEVRGVGAKIWSMILADLLLAGDPDREQWVTVGASMIAVDRLVHAFLTRSGLIDRFGVRHAVGPACYGLGGCASAIDEIAQRFDARTINPAFPAVFPRLVQHSIWAFCAADQWNVCNANQIDDRERCNQRFCPCFRDCDRVAIGRAAEPLNSMV